MLIGKIVFMAIVGSVEGCFPWLYEEMLDVGLAGLHPAVDQADQVAAAAALLASAQVSEVPAAIAG